LMKKENKKARIGVQPIRAFRWSNGFVSSEPIVLNSSRAAHTSFR